MWKKMFAMALFSLSSYVMAATQVVDDFESGVLGPQWAVLNGIIPADVDVYNAISATYDGGEGPKLYYAHQGSWMVVIESGDPATILQTSFTVSNGATLEFSWFFHTMIDPHDGYNDFAGVAINGTETTLITSATTGGGVGGENTGWREFSLPLSPGQVDLGLWVKNDAINYQFDSQFAIDNIRVTYAVPEASTWAMMLSGLGLIGYIAGRKKLRA